MIRRMTSLLPRVLIFTAALLPAAFAAGAVAEDVFPGPVRASVTRVLDGDTIEIQAHL
jgi:hypothetical protein